MRWGHSCGFGTTRLYCWKRWERSSSDGEVSIVTQESGVTLESVEKSLLIPLFFGGVATPALAYTTIVYGAVSSVASDRQCEKPLHM